MVFKNIRCDVSVLERGKKMAYTQEKRDLRAFMVKVDQAEADPTRAAEIASFMVVLLMLVGK